MRIYLKNKITLVRLVKGMQIGEMHYLRVINNRVYIGRYNVNIEKEVIMANYPSIALLSMSSMLCRLRDLTEPMEACWCYNKEYREQGVFRIFRIR
ncbi:MAG: hypothetical protein Q8909_19285 [Bacteroidota bacterium]|nr:hypothetical protein [Bacteroidota bacterium]